MRKISVLFVLIVIATTSCNKKDFDPGTTKQPNSSNGWWVTLQYTDGTVLTDHYFFSTYNPSADNQDSLWLDDIGFWPFKGKVALNYSALTFSNPTTDNVSEPGETANVSVGKILPLAGHSTTGVATDSLYMEVEFSDDPGTVYVIAGTARTGFIDDDY